MSETSDEHKIPPESDVHRSHASSLQVTEEFVLYKCDHFVDITLWPLTVRLNPRRWLSNFTANEKPFAIHLLHNFLYFSQPLMDQLLLSAFQDLSRFVLGPDEAFVSSQTRWRQFFDAVIITCVRGEEPNVTDSGLRFLRMARQVLGIDENRILSPEDTLARLLDSGPCPVVFLDDFVGSGQQFIATWARQVSLQHHKPTSFEQLASVTPIAQMFYCPLVCTETGHRNILLNCPGIKLNPAHFLTENYNALATDSVIWPEDMRVSGPQFIESVSLRAKISDWRGFNELGLALAFEHSVPDATLPLFYSNNNGWKPLLERK